MVLKMQAFKITLLVSAILISGFFYKLINTTSYSQVKKMAIGSDQILLDRNGQTLQRLRTKFEKRQISWVPLTSYSPKLTQAVINVEDQRFRSHIGFDPFAILRALKTIVQKKRIEGASTITMQLSDLISDKVLIKNQRIRKGFLSHKFNQILSAIFIELKWSKDEILEAYLNLIHLKGEYQGVQTFTLAYLNKSPNYLDNQESLIIASLIKEPNAQSKKLYHRACANAVRLDPGFDCISFNKVITKIFDTPPKISNNFVFAPHLARTLFKKYPQESFLQTYIDKKLQQKIYAILKNNIKDLQKKNVSDIAAIVIDNKSGEVLAYHGTVAEYSKSKQVDGVDSPRPAGSTLKPFLYARALENKIVTPATVIKDEPTALSWAGGLYRPTNYDKKFHGNVTLRQALAASLNVPSVKIIKMLGLAESFEVIKSLKFSDLKNPDFYGASIALGAVDVKLFELTNAYRAIANKGVHLPLKFVKNQQLQTDSSMIMTEDVAFLIQSILSDANARHMGFGWNSALETNFWTAVKTGTSKGLRDNWCIGFSEHYTVGVWAGNFASQSMVDVSGVTGAAPSWKEIMQYLHKNKKSFPPTQPKNIIQKNITFEWQIGERPEFFLKGTEPISSIGLLQKEEVQITFPAKNSVLALQSHLGDKSKVIFLRYNGNAPSGSIVVVNNVNMGQLSNPFKIANIDRGKYSILVKHQDKILDQVFFEVK